MTITKVTPAGPKFFYTPANITPNFLISTLLEGKLEVISHTRGYPLESGIYGNSIPSTVSLSQ